MNINIIIGIKTIIFLKNSKFLSRFLCLILSEGVEKRQDFLEVEVFYLHFTVSKALNIKLFERCQLVAGKDGLNRTIRSVSIMDTVDTRGLKNGDLLLTTGFVFKDDTDKQIQLIQEMANRGCAGLAIKVKRFFSTTPEAMRAEADRLHFPLIEIPYDISLSDLLVLVTREIFNRENFFNDQKRKKEFFTELFSGGFTNKDAIINQLAEYGVFLNNSFAVMYCLQKNSPVSGTTNSDMFLSLISEIETKYDLKMYVVKLDHYIIIIQPQDSLSLERQSVKEAANYLVDKYQKQFPDTGITIGIGNYKEEAVHLISSYIEARNAIELGLQLNNDGIGKVYEYTAMEPDFLLRELPDSILNNFLSSALNPLIKYDEQNDTELLKTLEVFLQCRGKIEDTARSLFLHRNTVKFRITRIEELLKVDFKNGEELFRLQLGLRAARLLHKIK